MGTPTSDAQRQETLDAWNKFKNQFKAAEYLNIPRTTFQARLTEANRWANTEKIEPERITPRDPKEPFHYAVRIRHQVDTHEPIRVLGIGDAHDSPSLPDKSRFYWMGRQAAELQVTHVIQIGDFLTFDSLCRYEGNDTLRGKHKPSFRDDILSGKDALSAFRDGLCGYKPELHLLLGNHEDRAFSFTNRTPEMEGILAGEIDNLFASFDWNVYPYGQINFFSGVGFVHVPLNRLGKPYGGKTAKNQIANDCLHDLVFGHDHMGGEITAQKVGTNQSVTVLNLGCALPMGHVEAYVGHGQSGWRYGCYSLEIEGRIRSAKFYSMNELEASFG